MVDVKFVRAKNFIIIAFTNDDVTSSFGVQQENIGLYDVQSHVVDKSAHKDIKHELINYDIDKDPFGFLIAHIAVSYGCITYCDVGAHLGVTTMDAVLTCVQFGVTPHAFAFDAGQAAQLTWRNFEINGFQITFEEVAIAASNGHAIFHIEEGDSVNNRLVNGRNSKSYPVRTLRLDNYLENKSALRPMAIKIDTQGAEPAVIAGMSGLRHLPVAIMLEFTPWAIRESGQDPDALLENLQETHHLFELGSLRQRRIEIIDRRSTIINVDSSEPYWTDILAVPRNLVLLDEVLARLRKPTIANHEGKAES